MTTKPNIVFILTDDHGSGAISAYGSKINVTPNIDSIAKAGVRIDNCYCTNSICTPSRATILTGTYSHINQVTTLETPIDASQPTFISQLREHGYKTAIVGKWHMGEGPGHNPENFDYWAVLRDQGEYFNPQILTKDGIEIIEGYATDIITDLSLAWMQAQPADQPWCMLIHHKAPHRSWEPDEKHMHMFEDPIDMPDTFFDDYATKSFAVKRAMMRVAEDLTLTDLKMLPPEDLAGDDLARWKYQRYMQDYLRCIASVDDNIGRVLDFLQTTNQYENTATFYTSDQGFFLGDHGWFDKRFMYEEALRMPLVVAYPARMQPRPPMNAMITNVDFAQTILDITDTPAHPRMQGKSFWPLLQRETMVSPEDAMDALDDTIARTDDEYGLERDAIYYRYWENDEKNHHTTAHYGIRTKRYKLIYFYADGLGLPGCSPLTFTPEWEMFDMQTDPAELVNIYHDPAYHDIREQLKVRMWELQAECLDTPHHTQPVPEGMA